MLFNSVEFLMFFIVVISIISILKYRKFQHIFLIISSYFFFYFSSNYLISLLIISTVLDYYLGREIYKSKEKRRKKILLGCSLAGNLILLGFFKYADFAIGQFNILGNYLNIGSNIPLLDLVLPIGISFYTFQTISYTVDIYRGNLEPSKTLKEFALFVSFFPQLVAGPIVRASHFLPQLREKMEKFQKEKNLKLIIIQNSNLKFGITLMAFGFLKKMFFADNIALIANDVFAKSSATSFEIWFGIIAFSMQIYGDFSGYSDIAIGAALILGFNLPINFNKPYFATSPADFWRRWHISLSTWLRDYLYIPLGGNKKSFMRTYGNLFTVMILGGLWHGASINFIIWGSLHGSYLAGHRIIQKIFPKFSNHVFFKTKFGKIIALLITQYFVLLAWIPFRVQDSEMMYYAMTKFIVIDFNYGIVEFILAHKFSTFILVLFIILHFISFRKQNIIKNISNANMKIWALVLTVIALSIALVYNGNPEDFIYFRF